MAKHSPVPKVTTDHYHWPTECSPSLPQAFSPPLQRVSRLLKMTVRSPTIWHLATNTNSTSFFTCKCTEIFPKWNSSPCSRKLYTKKKKRKPNQNKPSLPTTNTTVTEEGLCRPNKHSETPLAGFALWRFYSTPWTIYQMVPWCYLLFSHPTWPHLKRSTDKISLKIQRIS